MRGFGVATVQLLDQVIRTVCMSACVWLCVRVHGWENRFNLMRGMMQLNRSFKAQVRINIVAMSPRPGNGNRTYGVKEKRSMSAIFMML